MTKHPKIITIENKKLVGHSIQMSLEQDKTVALFSRFMPQRKHILNAINNNVFEVLLYKNNDLKNFNPSNTFTKWAAVEVTSYDNVPKGMRTFDLESSLYAAFTYKGLAKDFGKFIHYIFTYYLPQSVYALDNRPHFNVLSEKTTRHSPDSEEKVWIPITLK